MEEILQAPSLATPNPRQKERRFYLAFAIIVAVLVFVGFSRTYYIRPLLTQPVSNAPVLTAMHHLHGLAFTAWIILLLAQTWLISARKTALHRRLGMAGLALALVMIGLGVWLSLINASRGISLPGIPPLVFIGVTLPDLLIFGIFVGAGIFYRKRPDMHKRFMAMATIAILTAATARFTRILLPASPMPDLFMGWIVVDALIIACAVFDWVTLRRIHRVTLLAGGIYLLSEPLRLMIANTPAWVKFAGWLASLV